MAAAAAAATSTTAPPVGAGGGSLLKQTLMNVDECFVYKVPPLKTAGGHRAEQWDLANPIQTCGFQVERRDNDLFLLFTTDHHTKLFALSKMEGSSGASSSSSSSSSASIEPVADSSRYFVTYILNPQTNHKALIGFGFRDRDVAIDLLGNLQQFQKSIQREIEAKNMKVSEIPVLAKGEKMHINIPSRKGGGGSSSSSSKKSTTIVVDDSGKTATPSSPILLKKKPPKAFTPEDRNIHLSMGDLDLNADHLSTASTDSENAQAKSIGASTRDDGFDDDDGGINDDIDNDDDEDFGAFQSA